MAVPTLRGLFSTIEIVLCRRGGSRPLVLTLGASAYLGACSVFPLDTRTFVIEKSPLVTVQFDDAGSGAGAAPPDSTHDAGGSVDASTGGAPSFDAGFGGRPPNLGADAGPCQHIDPLGVFDCDRTVTTNSDFNLNINGWNKDSEATIVWDSRDSEESQKSGSISVTNDEQSQSGGRQANGALQCIPVAAGASYTLTAEAYIPPGQTYFFAGISTYLYKDANCEGQIGAYNPGTVTDAPGQWHYINLAVVAAGFQSMAVRLVVDKPYVDKPTTALFDAVRVKVFSP